MYSKAVLNPTECEAIYKEPVFTGDPGHVILQHSRMFQEYLGAINFEEGRAITKGDKMEVKLDFPDYVPSRNPLQNWFQIALLNTAEAMPADPLSCAARYKGFLPGVLYMPKFRPAKFILEDDPRHMPVNYALFIYDSADSRAFTEGIANLLGGCLNKDEAVVSDTFGNKILVSNSSKQPMVLIPVSLLIGGKGYLVNAWEAILDG